MQQIGKYKIQRLIARGGMGALYLAHDPDLDREVAIKVMSDDIMRDEQARARFNREARAAARLQHRNIVTVFDFAHDGDIPYFVMEFLRGQNLSQRLRQGPPLTLPMKLDLAIQICDGLHFAHGEGVIHRDIKPANIWVLEDGGVKLLDFGIAKSATGTLTIGSSVVGSAGYMSPEQIEGQPVDGRSDLFSVGAVLFELVAGRSPFDADSVTAVMMKIVQDEPPPDLREIDPGTPPALAMVVNRALQKDPDNRYADAARMVADLRAVRFEIAEQNERTENTAVSQAAPETRVIPPRPRLDGVAADLPIRPVDRSLAEAQTVIATGDYVLRPPEETVFPGVTEHSAPGRSRNRRGILIAGAAVATAVAVALATLVWPERFFGESPPPRFRVVSTPEGATIIVNGVDTGLRTPADVEIAQLPAKIRLESAGYEPFVTEVTEQAANAADRSIRASLVEVPPPPPTVQQPPPTVQQPPPEKPPIPPPAPRPVGGELTVLRTPGKYSSCNVSIGRTRPWTGRFDGLSVIKLPAQRHPLTIQCAGETISGEILIPPGKSERSFNDVVTLKEPSNSPGQP